MSSVARHLAPPAVPTWFAVVLLALSFAGCGLLGEGEGGGGGSPDASTASKPQEVNCAEACPCECKCEEKAEDDMPDKNAPYGLVFAGNVRVSEGSLPLSVLKSRIASERLSLRECYVPALEKNPELKGEVDVQFTVSGATGKIIAAIVRESTLENKEVETCVTRKVKAWTFPKTDDGKETVVRFTAAMFAASL